SSHVDRFTFTDNSEYLNIESLIKNLKNMIMKELFILYITESLIFSSVSSTAVSLSAALSQSSILLPVFSSLTFTISVLMTLTSATSSLSVSAAASAFIISSSYFKKMLYRLDKLCFSRIISLLNSVKIINICVFRNENTDIILFYTHRYETYTSYLR
ncbi:hypothetical protein BDBG_18085, partial [Blastomyces gilchristii SLH14081]